MRSGRCVTVMSPGFANLLLLPLVQPDQYATLIISQLFNLELKRAHLRAASLLVLCFASLLIQFAVSTRASADELEFPPIERRITMGSNWLLSLNISTLDNMLNYPGSLIHPITQVRVILYTHDFRTQSWSKGQIYEDLWFSNGRPVGSRRYLRLQLPPGSYGNIYVVRTKDCSSQTKALDDTILRLFVDLVRLNSILSAVVLPQDICDNAASDLGIFNFYPANIIGAGKMLMLHFQSTPMSYDKYFVYTVKD